MQTCHFTRLFTLFVLLKLQPAVNHPAGSRCLQLPAEVRWLEGGLIPHEGTCEVGKQPHNSGLHTVFVLCGGVGDAQNELR